MKSQTPLGILCLVFIAIIFSFRLEHEDTQGEANNRAGDDTALE